MTSRPALLASAVAGVSGVLSAATVTLVWLSGAGLADFVAENLANTWLAGVSSGVVAVLILWERPGNRLGVVFGAASLLAASSAAAIAYSDLAFDEAEQLPLRDLACLVAGVCWLPAFLLVLTGAPLMFPRGTLASPRWRWPARVALGAGVAAPLVLSFTDAVVHDVQPTATNPLPTPVPDEVLLAATIGCFFLTVAIGVAATIGLALRMRRLGQPDRQQHAWYVAAVLTIIVVTWLPVPDWVNFVGNGLSVVALGVAIVRYQLFDIELALSRAVVYGLLTAGAMGAYLLAVGALGAGVGAGLWPALAAAVAALGLAGLRGRLQTAVDRALYGDRDDPLAALMRLGDRLGGAVAADDVLPAIADTVRQSLRAPYAAVELDGESGPAHASGVEPEKTVRFDLNHAGEHVGWLVVGLRRSESRVSAADLRLVTAFAQQAAVAAHDARLNRELRKSRERIVLAREEERRRLRRDLHDGLGPALAGVSLGLETAGRSAVRGDASLPALIERLHNETDRCASNIRQIVADLRPAVLDTIGLVDALRQHAELLTSRSTNGFRVTVEGESPLGLPAAVEVAAYRIALEALTNTVRHADARSCAVSVKHDGGLRLTMRDDGCGLPAAPPGVGLTSMRDRAEELGGACTVTFVEGVGTTVEAVLPLYDAGPRAVS